MAQLPENIDATYADDLDDPSAKLHQQFHDSLHTLNNRIEAAVLSAAAGQSIRRAATGPAFEAFTPAASGSAALATVRGVHIPKGSLDTWKAARDAHASQLVEVAIFGDSTTFGATDLGGNNNYSWVQRLRALSKAAGYTDGGKGIAGIMDPTILHDTGEVSAIQANTGFGSGGSFDVLLTETAFSNTADNSITFQGYGTMLRLYYSRLGAGGEFTYSVDGGAAVVVNSNSSTTSAAVITVTGLAEGLHTVTVVNRGGVPITGPTAEGVSTAQTGGTLAGNTTYRYVVTSVTASGESTPGPEIVATTQVGDTNTVSFQIVNKGGTVTSYNVYRVTGATGGTFLRHSNVASGAGTYTAFTDTGTATALPEPPTTSTAGMNTATKDVRVVAEFLRAVGLVYHKDAISGISFGSFFDTANADLGNFPAQLALGLLPGTVGSVNGWGWGQQPGPKPTYRNVKLAICALGINDQQGATGAPEAIGAGIEQRAAIFARMARAAGADPLVVIPHNQYAAQAHTYGGTVARAIRATAEAHNCAIVDFNEALGPPNTGVALYTVGPHLNRAAYEVEAAFLWDNCLGLPSYTP